MIVTPLDICVAVVPFIAVSSRTPRGFISNTRQDFGSIARFIEHNFLIREGSLDFADARQGTDLLLYFKLRPYRESTPVPTKLDANYFINDKRPPLPPDDD